jgi:hypothetical protein
MSGEFIRPRRVRHAMTFHYSDSHRDDYYQDGLTILRGVIPATLLADLRQQTDRAREIARERSGPQSQRLQPVYAYDELDARPFRDFLELPGMRAAVENILGTERDPSQIMGVLLEPAEQPWCTNWHRDWGHHIAELGTETFVAACRNLRMFNQLNAALYDDHSLWVVPGSHNRGDTPGEQAAFGSVPAPGPNLTPQMTPAEREIACQVYVRQMPGATHVALQAGDVAFYRACGWHIGTYVPYTRRATLHDGFYCDDDYAWQAQMRQLQESKKGQ